MRGLKLSNLYGFLSDYKHTEQAADYFKEILNFELNTKMAQDKMVELGQILSRVISLQFTLNLGEKGFNNQLISSTVETLRSDVHGMMGSFKTHDDSKVIENYEESSSWLEAFSVVPA